MGLQDQAAEFGEWYNGSFQYEQDKALFKEWQERVDNGEKLYVHFDPNYQNQVNAAAARLNALKEYKNAKETAARASGIEEEYRALIAAQKQGESDYKPEKSLIEAVGETVKPIADIYLKNPIIREIVDKTTQWKEGAKQGYNELVNEGNNVANKNPLALSGTPMKENVTNAPAPEQTEQQKQDLNTYQNAVNNFTNETVKPAAYAAGLVVPEVALPFLINDLKNSVEQQGIGKTIGDFTSYTAVKNAIENPDEFKEKLLTQPLTTTAELLPAIFAGRFAYKGGKHFFEKSPTDTTYTNSVLTPQDKRNGYILEERWEVKYRVKRSTKELHPQDKHKFQRRLEDMQNAIDEMNANPSVALDDLIGNSNPKNIKITQTEGDLTQGSNNTGKLSGSLEESGKSEISVATKELTQTEGTLVQGSSKVGIPIRNFTAEEISHLAATQAERGAAQEAAQAAQNTGWVNKEGKTLWPQNDGFVGVSQKVTFQPGARIDRYGITEGSYVSPAGSSYEMRALAPGTETRPYNVYEVVKPLDALGGEIAPWFNQPGGGLQFKLDRTIQELLDEGFIRKVGS